MVANIRLVTPFRCRSQ